MNALTFTAEHRGLARDGARGLMLKSAREREYLNTLAREAFLAWVRDRGYAVDAASGFWPDPSCRALVELLDICDVIVAGRRVGLVGLWGSDCLPRIDRRAVDAGYHADVYVFVEIDEARTLGTLLGALPFGALIEAGSLDSSGRNLTVMRHTVRSMDQFGAMLALPRATGEASWEEDHDDVFDRLAEYVAGDLPPEDLGPFEVHVFRCGECREQLLTLLKVVEALHGHSWRTWAPAVRSREDVASDIIDLHAWLDTRRSTLAASGGGVFPLLEPDGTTVEARISPDPDEIPRLTAGGAVAGTLLLPDTGWNGRIVRLRLRLGLTPADRIEPFEAGIRGDRLTLSHPIASPAIRDWLARHAPATGLELGPAEMAIFLRD